MITNMLFMLAYALLRVFELALFARAIFSWFQQGRNNKVYEVLYAVTEPVIMPFRALVNRFNVLRGLPLDIAYLLTWLVLEFLMGLLYSI